MKNTLINGIDIFSGMIPLKYLLRLAGFPLILPFYHTVSDKRLPHIANVCPQKSEIEFVKDLDFFLKNFEPLDLSQLLEVAQGKLVLNKPCFHLSFDDGLSEFYNIISPVLEKKGVPATVFLNSAFVDNKDLFYRYKISLILEKLREGHPANSVILKILNILGINKRSQIKKVLLNDHSNTGNISDRIAELLCLDFDDYLKKQKPYLSTGQIKELAGKGFHFGAHSIDHPYFSLISYEDQIKQVKESTGFVKNIISCPVTAFAFPFTDFGVSKSLFDKLYSDNICQLSFGTAGIKYDEFPFHLQRISMERKNLPAQKNIATEYIYFMLKKAVNKNHIRRTG